MGGTQWKVVFLKNIGFRRNISVLIILMCLGGVVVVVLAQNLGLP